MRFLARENPLVEAYHARAEFPGAAGLRKLLEPQMDTDRHRERDRAIGDGETVIRDK
jgi:hypothetical protein